MVVSQSRMALIKIIIYLILKNIFTKEDSIMVGGQEHTTISMLLENFGRVRMAAENPSMSWRATPVGHGDPPVLYSLQRCIFYSYS